MSLFGFGVAGASNVFNVQKVAAGVITANVAVHAPACSGNRKWELRRPGVAGIAEFGGMVASVQGKQIRFTTGGVKNPPKVGDKFIVYCADQGGSTEKPGRSKLPDPGDSTILPGEAGMGIPLWAIVIGGGILLMIALKK